MKYSVQKEKRRCKGITVKNHHMMQQRSTEQRSTVNRDVIWQTSKC